MQGARGTTAAGQAVGRLSATALGALLLGQAAGAAAAAQLQPGAERVLVPGALSLVVLHNSGVAFGLLGGLSPWLTVALALTVLAVLFYNKNAGSARGVEQVAYGLMVGGALGNIADRLRFGYVIDYIDVHIWPVFNVSDAFVVAGAALAAAASFIRKPGGDMGVGA